MSLAAAAITAALAADAAAQSVCEPKGWRHVLLTAGVSAGAGMGAAVASSAILATADHTRDYKFYVGASVGGGVALSLSVLYGIVDYYSGCRIAEEAGGFAWSIPIVTLVVGGALPVAMWGATPKKDDSAEATQAITTPLFRYSLRF